MIPKSLICVPFHRASILEHNFAFRSTGMCLILYPISCSRASFLDEFPPIRMISISFFSAFLDDGFEDSFDLFFFVSGLLVLKDIGFKYSYLLRDSCSQSLAV